LIAKRIRRDVLLVVLEKAKQNYSFRLYGICLMANHIHLLIKPDDASQLPKLMHWVGWSPPCCSTALQDGAGTSGRQGITPHPLPQTTTKGHSIP
jgi:hypothetical protein